MRAVLIFLKKKLLQLTIWTLKYIFVHFPLKYIYTHAPFPKKFKNKLKISISGIFRHNFAKYSHLLSNPREFLSSKYIAGQGIEIGALHFPLWVKEGVQVKYVDLYSKETNEGSYPELSEKPIVNTDIIDDGETLEIISAKSQDFIIANHFIEHCINPLGTIRVHLTKLRPNGILFYAIPNKDLTFDVNRPLTTFQHLVEEDAKGPSGTKEIHYREWVRLVDKISEEKEIEEKIKVLINSDNRIHFHCWDKKTLKDFFGNAINYLDRSFLLENFLPNGSEIMVILRKTSE